MQRTAAYTIQSDNGPRAVLVYTTTKGERTWYVTDDNGATWTEHKTRTDPGSPVFGLLGMTLDMQLDALRKNRRVSA